MIDPGAGQFALLVIGTTRVAMVHAGGPISGRHANPAMTLAAWLRRACEKEGVAPYMTAQVPAGIIAALVVGNCKAGVEATAAGPHAAGRWSSNFCSP